MILKRELYNIMPWHGWLRLRLMLHWARLTGGVARALGVRGHAPEVWEHAVAGERHHAVPMAGVEARADELQAAAAVCPTRAFETDLSGRRTVLHRPKCVLCGLCYFVAPHSLAPGSQEGQACLGVANESVEFPWR